jgi:3-oxoacyl-[acyl-carrier protein] reductase
MERVTIVTGAASGIGRAAAELLACRGYGVVAVDLDEERLGWTRTNENIVPLAGDVCSKTLNARAVATAVDRFGRLDASVLNAGIPSSGDLIDSPLDAFDRTIEVNVRAVLLGIRAAVPAMREAGGGRIVVTASTSGLGGDPLMWAYNTAKAGVINLVRAAAIDLAAEDITVNAVCPGPTETQMTAGIKLDAQRHEDLRRAIPAQRWGRPEEIAAVIAFLVSPEASFVTGTAIPVDGGITASTGQFRPVGRRPAADKPTSER